MDIPWNWDYAWESLRIIVVDGLPITLAATVLGSILAYTLGLVLALLRRSGMWLVRTITWLFVEFVRSTPLLVQALLLWFVLPDYGVRISALTTGVLALGVHYATYTSEVYRAGIEAVPSGQWEAATALSLPRARTWTSVILPQAIPRVVPALGNYTISMFKEVPLLLAISVLGMVGVAFELGSAGFAYVEPITIVGSIFLILSYSSSLLTRWMERRVGSIRT